MEAAGGGRIMARKSRLGLARHARHAGRFGGVIKRPAVLASRNSVSIGPLAIRRLCFADAVGARHVRGVGGGCIGLAGAAILQMRAGRMHVKG
jgi:hypothetical protein